MQPDGSRQSYSPRRLINLSATELFEELQRASLVVAAPAGEAMRMLRINQIELELQSREMQETVGDLDVALTTFAEHFYEAPLAYLVLDAGGQITRANRLACRLLGAADEAQLHRREMAQWLTPESASAWNTSLQRAAQRRRGQTSGLSLLLHHDLPPVHAAISPDLDGIGRHRGFRVLLSPRGRVGRHRECVHMLRQMDADVKGKSQDRGTFMALLVPTLADLAWWDQVCANGRLRRTAAAQTPGTSLASAQAGPRRHAIIRGGQSIQQQVQASGLPMLMSDCARSASAEGHPPVAAEARSIIVVPMMVDEKVGAVMTLIRRRPAACYTTVDLALAEHVVQRAGEQRARPAQGRRARHPASPAAQSPRGDARGDPSS